MKTNLIYYVVDEKSFFPSCNGGSSTVLLLTAFRLIICVLRFSSLLLRLLLLLYSRFGFYWAAIFAPLLSIFWYLLFVSVVNGKLIHTNRRAHAIRFFTTYRCETKISAQPLRCVCNFQLYSCGYLLRLVI